jgi:hypothetical protein
VTAVRQRVGADVDTDPRVVALELGNELLAVTDRRTLAPGVRAELRGNRILYRWTHDDWRTNLWIGIGLALKQARPALRSCRPTCVRIARP